MVEASEIKTHTEVKTPIIKAITTKAITVSTIIHVEAIIRAIITASTEAEAMGMPEVITMAMAAAGQIMEVITITNTISIMVMIMITSQSNRPTMCLMQWI